MTLNEAEMIEARGNTEYAKTDEQQALTVLRDALREAQAQTVQMTTQIAELSACMVPLPAARTYDDGVRDAAKAIRDQAIRTFGKPTTVANGYAEVVESLLSPAPAVAPVAAPRPLHPADCAHDSTPEVSVPHMPDSCGFVSDTNHVACPLPFGHAGWHRTPPVAAPKPGPEIVAVSSFTPPFDAEAALAQMLAGMDREINMACHGRSPITTGILHDLIAAGLAAGRGAR